MRHALHLHFNYSVAIQSHRRRSPESKSNKLNANKKRYCNVQIIEYAIVL